MAAGVSRAVIEVLLDRINQGAGTLSPEGRLTYANQRFASMLGVTRAQIVGKLLAELVAEPDRSALATALEACRDTASQCRLVLPRPNGGGELQALVTFAPLGHGQASCLVTDVAQGKQASALAHEIRTSVEILRRNSLDENSQRALDRIVELIEDPRQDPRVRQA